MILPGLAGHLLHFTQQTLAQNIHCLFAKVMQTEYGNGKNSIPFAKNRDGCGLLLNNGKMEIDRCQPGQWLPQQGMVKQSRMGKVNVCLEVNVSAVYFGEIP